MSLRPWGSGGNLAVPGAGDSGGNSAVTGEAEGMIRSKVPTTVGAAIERMHAECYKAHGIEEEALTSGRPMNSALSRLTTKVVEGGITEGLPEGPRSLLTGRPLSEMTGTTDRVGRDPTPRDEPLGESGAPGAPRAPPSGERGELRAPGEEAEMAEIMVGLPPHVSNSRHLVSRSQAWTRDGSCRE